MTLAVALFGLFAISLGMTGVLAPGRLLAGVTRLQSQLGLLGIALLRLGLGMALLLASSRSRAPVFLQVLGVLSLISGAITPFVGVERFERIMAWWRARTPLFVRAWSLLVLLFGASLLWAVLPDLRA